MQVGICNYARIDTIPTHQCLLTRVCDYRLNTQTHRRRQNYLVHHILCWRINQFPSITHIIRTQNDNKNVVNERDSER